MRLAEPLTNRYGTLPPQGDSWFGILRPPESPKSLLGYVQNVQGRPAGINRQLVATGIVL